MRPKRPQFTYQRKPDLLDEVGLRDVYVELAYSSNTIEVQKINLTPENTIEELKSVPEKKIEISKSLKPENNVESIIAKDASHKMATFEVGNKVFLRDSTTGKISSETIESFKKNEIKTKESNTTFPSDLYFASEKDAENASKEIKESLIYELNITDGSGNKLELKQDNIVWIIEEGLDEPIITETTFSHATEDNKIILDNIAYPVEARQIYSSEEAAKKNLPVEETTKEIEQSEESSIHENTSQIEMKPHEVAESSKADIKIKPIEDIPKNIPVETLEKKEEFKDIEALKEIPVVPSELTSKIVEKYTKLQKFIHNHKLDVAETTKILEDKKIKDEDVIKDIIKISTETKISVENVSSHLGFLSNKDLDVWEKENIVKLLENQNDKDALEYFNQNYDGNVNSVSKIKNEIKNGERLGEAILMFYTNKSDSKLNFELTITGKGFYINQDGTSDKIHPLNKLGKFIKNSKEFTRFPH